MPLPSEGASQSLASTKVRSAQRVPGRPWCIQPQAPQKLRERMAPGFGGQVGRILYNPHIHMAPHHPQGSSTLLWISRNPGVDGRSLLTSSLASLVHGHPTVSASPNPVTPSGRQSQPRENDLYGMVGPEAGPTARPSLKLGTRMRNVLWAGKPAPPPPKQTLQGGQPAGAAWLQMTPFVILFCYD